MANNKIQIKRTTISGRTPNTTNSSNTAYIDAGELAINLTDQKVFTSNGSAHFEVGSNLSTLTVSTIIANGSVGSAGEVLASDGANLYWTNTTGDQGYTGSQGIQGYTGSQGDQGLQGYTGSQGVIGYTGSQGEQGIQGYTGSQGDLGIQGYTGSQGEQGIQGYTGSQGEQGIQGYTGSQGDQGLQGYTGSQGDIGYTGSQGEQGLQGYTGSQGEQGIQGYTGSRGDLGYTGSQGDMGYVGSQGDIGYTGSQGDLGYTGSIGYTGSQGIQGYTGSQGDLGYTGSIGYTGSKGADGNFGGASFYYQWDNETNVELIANGYVLLSDANVAAANVMSISVIDRNSANISSFIQTIDDSTSAIKGSVKLTEEANTLNFVIFNIVDAHTDHGNHFDIPVSYVYGSTLAPANGTNIVVSFLVNGDRGDVGYTGSQGVTGYTGSKGTTFVSNTAPTPAVAGDTWWNSETGIRYVYYTDGDSSQWVQESAVGPMGLLGYTGSTGYTGSQGVIGYTGSAGAGGGSSGLQDLFLLMGA